MKKDKYSLLKVLGIAFGLFIILSYIIPVGYFSSETITKGTTDPVGLLGIFKNPIYSMGIFVQYFIVFLAIGVFYAVISKTGVYSKLVDKCVKKVEKRKTLFLIINIIVFALLSSLTGLSLLLFLFVPFISTIILLLGFDKITALVSTVGSIIVGTMGSTYGTALIYKNLLGIDSNDCIVYKFIFLGILIFLLIMYILGKNKSKLKQSKEETTKEETIIPFYDKNQACKKSSLPLIVMAILTFLIAVLGMFNWYYTFGIDVFTNMHEAITEFKIGDYPIFSNILGSTTELGYWGNYEFATLLLISSLIIGWVYSVKMKDLLDSMVDGAKKMLDPAVYVILACIIFTVMINGENGSISATITNFLLGLSKTFNVLLTSLTSLIGGFFFNDFPYFIQSFYVLISGFEEKVIPIITIVIQSSFGLSMLILPVSVILVAGLRYLNVSYKEWFKYIWKFLLQIFIIIIVYSLILTLIIK